MVITVPPRLLSRGLQAGFPLRLHRLSPTAGSLGQPAKGTAPFTAVFAFLLYRARWQKARIRLRCCRSILWPQQLFQFISNHRHGVANSENMKPNHRREMKQGIKFLPLKQGAKFPALFRVAAKNTITLYRCHQPFLSRAGSFLRRRSRYYSK